MDPDHLGKEIENNNFRTRRRLLEQVGICTLSGMAIRGSDREKLSNMMGKQHGNVLILWKVRSL